MGIALSSGRRSSARDGMCTGVCDLLVVVATTTGDVVPPMVWGMAREGGDISLAGAGSPVDITGLRHTDVVTVVVVDVKLAAVTGMDRGDMMTKIGRAHV